MKIKRSTLIPAALLVYLAVMSSIGWKQYASGDMSAAEYFGIIGVTLAASACAPNAKPTSDVTKTTITYNNRNYG